MTVKAYPNISKKYGEAECVAGIRIDIEPAWVRLYPIPFRDLPQSQQFKKYQVIRIDAAPHGTDRRPESLRPNVDTLTIGKELKSDGKGWIARRQLVEPLITDSMCGLMAEQGRSGKSLGAFRPAEVIDVLVDREDEGWDPRRQAIVNQASLLGPAKQALEKIPYRFRYHYRCSDQACPGHKQTIVDWELQQGFRKWRGQYGEGGAIEQIKHKWLTQMCATDRDTIFFVGNLHQHPKQFLVLGVFWPKALQVNDGQLALLGGDFRDH